MREAAAFYEERAKGLGLAFLNEVEHAVTSILEHPNAGTVVGPDVRRRLVRRFPYGVLYRIESEGIVVVAIMHLKRKPGYWKRRG